MYTPEHKARYEAAVREQREDEESAFSCQDCGSFFLESDLCELCGCCRQHCDCDT